MPQKFTLKAIIKAPVFWIICGSCILMFFMGNVMNNIDPEELKQAQAQMGLNQDPNKMLGQLFGFDDSKEEELRKRSTKKAIKK